MGPSSPVAPLLQRRQTSVGGRFDFFVCFELKRPVKGLPKQSEAAYSSPDQIQASSRMCLFFVVARKRQLLGKHGAVWRHTFASLNEQHRQKGSHMSTHDTQLAFIGGGNMASAIIGGCVRNGIAGERILVIDPNPTNIQALTSTWGVRGVTDAGDASEGLKAANVVVWAVKPQIFKEVALADQAFFSPQALHLSVAAGVTCASIRHWLQSDKIVRAMPNTPALVGAGATALYAMPSVSEGDKALVSSILEATGLVLWVDGEQLLEAVTAVSGSGPAYVFYWLEAMVQAGTELGLDPDTAKRLATATFKGAALLADQSEDTPGVLRERVTSKGGTTFEALEVMRAGDVGPTIEKAMAACARRAREMGDAFGA